MVIALMQGGCYGFIIVFQVPELDPTCRIKTGQKNLMNLSPVTERDELFGGMSSLSGHDSLGSSHGYWV